MVFSITSSYKRKLQVTGAKGIGTATSVIKKQIKKNFDVGGRPRKWKRNTRVTIDWKRKKSFIIKPNFARSEMRNVAVRGRIRTIKRKNKVVMKYIIPTSQSRNPNKFSAAHVQRSVQPFGNPNISTVTVPARPFVYISRQAYNKILSMATTQIEGIVVGMACPPEVGGKVYQARDAEAELNRWAKLKG